MLSFHRNIWEINAQTKSREKVMCTFYSFNETTIVTTLLYDAICLNELDNSHTKSNENNAIQKMLPTKNISIK